jgi:hypothetical protein
MAIEAVLDGDLIVCEPDEIYAFTPDDECYLLFDTQKITFSKSQRMWFMPIKGKLIVVKKGETLYLNTSKLSNTHRLRIFDKTFDPTSSSSGGLNGLVTVEFVAEDGQTEFTVTDNMVAMPEMLLSYTQGIKDRISQYTVETVNDTDTKITFDEGKSENAVVEILLFQ